jgi:nitroreductase
MNRRSVREYTGEGVSDESVKQLLRAGMYAPSAKNSQPWEFIVVTERATLDTLSGGAPYWRMLAHAPLCIVVAANLTDYKSSGQEFFVQDCAACTQNILVAAEGMGLGGVWLGCYSAQERMAYVQETLGVPDGIIPFSVLSIGHPAAHPKPHDFYLEEKVYYGAYGRR